MRLLVPFSGQRDAIDLTVSCAEAYPENPIDLLFVCNIGLRESSAPPLRSALAVAANLPQVERLIAIDAKYLRMEIENSFPHDISQALGERSVCAACQASLLMLSARVAARCDAVLVGGPREALGGDLDVSLKVMVRELASKFVEIVAVSTRSASALGVVIDGGQRCRLAGEHDTSRLLDPDQRVELSSWLTNISKYKLSNMALPMTFFELR